MENELKRKKCILVIKNALDLLNKLIKFLNSKASFGEFASNKPFSSITIAARVVI